jgi:hypothetical protein
MEADMSQFGALFHHLLGGGTEEKKGNLRISG